MLSCLASNVRIGVACLLALARAAPPWSSPPRAGSPSPSPGFAFALALFAVFRGFFLPLLSGDAAFFRFFPSFFFGFLCWGVDDDASATWVDDEEPF